MWEDLFGGMEGGGGAYSDMSGFSGVDPNVWDAPSTLDYGAQSVANGFGSPGGMDWLKSFLSNPKNLAGLAATGLGAAAGSQGGGGAPGSTMDPRLESFIYGGGGIVPRAEGMLNNQLGAAQDQGASMIGKGAGLLGQSVAGNGVGSVQMHSPTTASNPYLTGMADDMQRRTSELLAQNNNQIAGRQVAAGGMGSTRMGVAQGTAAGQAADSLQGQLAGMYGNAYNADANRATQQYGMDQNFFSNQRGQDLAGAQLGGNLMQGGMDMQWSPLNQANGLMKPYSNLQSASSGGGMQGLLGGALTGASVAGKLGWW